MKVEKYYYLHHTGDDTISSTSAHPTAEQMARLIQPNIVKHWLEIWPEVSENSIAGSIYKQVYDMASELNIFSDTNGEGYSHSVNVRYDFLTGYRIKDFLSNLLKEQTYTLYPEIFTLHYNDTRKTKVGVFVFEDGSQFFVCNIKNAKKEGCPFAVGFSHVSENHL